MFRGFWLFVVRENRFTELWSLWNETGCNENVEGVSGGRSVAVPVPAVISAVREITRENISAVEPGIARTWCAEGPQGSESLVRAQRLNEII